MLAQIVLVIKGRRGRVQARIENVVTELHLAKIERAVERRVAQLV